jgi:hypothetical protein
MSRPWAPGRGKSAGCRRPRGGQSPSEDEFELPTLTDAPSSPTETPRLAEVEVEVDESSPDESEQSSLALSSPWLSSPDVVVAVDVVEHADEVEPDGEVVVVTGALDVVVVTGVVVVVVSGAVVVVSVAEVVVVSSEANTCGCDVGTPWPVAA